MCGIVGIVGNGEVAPEIVEALRRLEYRGYDSAGLATLHKGELIRRRAEGKLARLAASIEAEPVPGAIGIGHTRWATHGAPSERNAHPHCTERVAVVHNGIIENFRDLRHELEAQGRVFQTETDTEVIAHLLTVALDAGLSEAEAVVETLKRLRGAYALAILFVGNGEVLHGARRGSPLAIGYGESAMFLGSDALALAPLTNRIAYLEDGDRVELTRAGAQVYDESGRVAEREIRIVPTGSAMVDKGNFRHFMAKEIHEQPTVLGYTLGGFLRAEEEGIALPPLSFDPAALPKVTLIGCGTAYYAGCVAKYWFEQIARIPTETDIASEFRYRDPVLAPGGLALFVSQSGETADTLAALRYARAHGQHVAAIVNVAESTIAREAQDRFLTHAGPEIGVASTKAFTCQLMVLAALAIAFGRARGAISAEEEQRLTHALIEVPRLITDILHHEGDLHALAQELAKARDVLYLGRGNCYPIALEGALKLKEISYIHAEGYAAGEMKHGPIALIDETMPLVVIAPSNGMFEKTASNMQEAVTRGGRAVLVSDRHGIHELGAQAWASFEMPKADPFVAPLLYAVPMQLLAYHTAVLKGTDVDQPRNLAKSVTVE